MNNVVKAKFTTKDDKHTGYMPIKQLINEASQKINQEHADQMRDNRNDGIKRRYSIK